MVLLEILEMNKIFFFLLILNFAFTSIVHSYQTNNGKKIVIIGAGASGLCAARRAISKGFDVTVFEQTEHIGGTWVYTDRTGYDDYGQLSLGTVYKSLLTNVPVEVMGYPDYEFASNGRSYVSHEDVRRFLESYANHFNLTSVIKFEHLVLRVTPTDSGQWEVLVKILKNNSYDVVKSDFIFVCNGINSSPNIPKFPGMEQFKGTQLHSRDYRTPDRFENETVLLIGRGPSGIDISQDVAIKATKVIISMRRNKTMFFPSNVVVKPDIARINPHSVVFTDGTEENVTTIMYCTGYKFSYPFLSVDSGVSVKGTEHLHPMYKHVININNPTIAFIGLQLVAFTTLTFDLQVRFALSIWSGNTTLPTKDEMLEDTQKFIQKQWDSGVKKRKGHFIGFETENYYRELTEMSGIEGLPEVYFKLFKIILTRFSTEPNTFRQYNYKILDNRTYESTFNNDR